MVPEWGARWAVPRAPDDAAAAALTAYTARVAAALQRDGDAPPHIVVAPLPRTPRELLVVLRMLEPPSGAALTIINALLALGVRVGATLDAGLAPRLPPGIEFYGMMQGRDLRARLTTARVFMATASLPIGGVEPLEALAAGARYIMPLLDPPLSRANSPFLAATDQGSAFTCAQPHLVAAVGSPAVLCLPYDAPAAGVDPLLAILQEPAASFGPTSPDPRRPSPYLPNVHAIRSAVLSPGGLPPPLPPASSPSASTGAHAAADLYA